MNIRTEDEIIASQEAIIRQQQHQIAELQTVVNQLTRELGNTRDQLCDAVSEIQWLQEMESG